MANNRETLALESLGVLNRIGEKIRQEILEIKTTQDDGINKERVYFAMYLDGTCAIVEDISEPFDPGCRELKEFETVNDFINWLEAV